MESECTACSKGLFALVTYISESDVLLQVLKDHKLVPATRKCPKCESVLNIDLHWLPIKAQIVFKICVLTYTALNTGKPAYLRNKLSKFTTELGVSIRYSHDPHRLNEPRMNKEIGTRIFKYSAPRLFNSLPRSVKDSGNLKVFKKRLKTFLFNECYDLA